MRNSDTKTRRTAPLQTPTDLGAQATKNVSAALNLLLADYFALYLKTKNFHWHISGPHFRDYHLLLDEHGDQLFATTDPIAERVRKLGGITIRSIGQMRRTASHSPVTNAVTGGRRDEHIVQNTRCLEALKLLLQAPLLVV